MPKDQNELNNFYEKLADLMSNGTETDVRAYIREQFPRLPENVRTEIMLGMFSTALEDEVREREAIIELQEEGIAALQILEAAEPEIKKQLSETQEL